MSYRSEWQAAKKKLDAAGIKSSQFYKGDLGPALDEYEKASADEEKVSGKDPQKADAALKKKKAAAAKASLIAAQYIKDTKWLHDNAQDNAHKKVLDDALTTLSMHIYANLKKNL